jgi:hypothetical protein
MFAFPEWNYRLLAVLITQDEAIRFAQDGTLPNSLQGLSVTGLDDILRAP